MRYDIELLRLFSKPVTVYQVIKSLGYPHSSAYSIVKHYVELGIVRNVRSEPYRTGLKKKYYMLTDLGINLLDILEKINRNRLGHNHNTN